MSTNVENVIVKNITWPKTDKADRTHDKDFMKRLALSIQTEGLLQAIGVRPDTEKGANHYIGVFGRHRSEAFLTQLKLELIPANVFTDMDAEEAAIAADTENLWRNPLNKTQHARAMARWHDSYDKKRQAYEAAVKANKAAEKADAPKPAKKTKLKTADEVQSGPVEFVEVAAPVALPELPPKPPENFAVHVSEVTGQSPTAVKRALKIGKAFTPAQLDIIEQQGVNQTWQDTIASLPKEQRDGVMNLIASGASEEDAIARVSETPEVKRADGKEYVVEPTAPGEKNESDMTDEEWVNFFCSETVGLLEDPSQFVAQAVLYRATRDIRQAFKTKAKGAIAEAKKAAVYGEFYAVVTRFMNIAHPSKWLRCGSCNGTGIVSEGNKQSKCRDCSGNGFKVKFEGK
jgi:hypothetical protein